eukprot:COSAG02_NODE_42564_length_383_cov_0.911972_1_plen_80_part_01
MPPPSEDGTTSVALAKAHDDASELRVDGGLIHQTLRMADDSCELMMNHPDASLWIRRVITRSNCCCELLISIFSHRACEI